MKKEKLKIGIIQYANLFPIFYMLGKEADVSPYEFVGGVPSELNRKLRGGEIDISPSSSIEYLRHEELYSFFENHSISSKGPVRSIILFSKKKIEDLEGVPVLTTSQSETSVALLRIVLKKFYARECPLVSSSEPLGKGLESSEAYLLIGDQALREALNWKDLHKYDLGELWYRHTGLPMTFALWIVRKDCCGSDPALLRQFRDDLDRAKNSALRNFGLIAKSSPLRDYLSEEALVEYWKGMSYDFGDEHKKGFALFRSYAEDLNLI